MALKMRQISYAEAINEVLREEMRRNERIILMGEDIGVFGGVYKITKGLLEEFGPERVYDTPISEDGFVGVAIGAAITGSRPVVEIMYPDFLLCCMNQLINHAAKLRYMSGGLLKVPLVVRTNIIQGRNSGADHSQVLIPLFMHIPGLYVVAPSTPYDVKGLLRTAMRCDSPTIFFEESFLYKSKGPVLEKEYSIPFGKANIYTEGEDVTIVGVSTTVHIILAATKRLEEKGISAEVIDLRTLVPLDKDTIIDSVKKTGKLVTVENSWRTCGIGAEIAALVIEEAFDYLDAPILRVATPLQPEPVSPPLVKLLLVNENKVIEAVKKIVT